MSGQTHCPYCNSLQDFRPIKDISGDRVRTYIRCSMCKSELTLSDRTKDEERAHLRAVSKGIGRIRRERKRRG